MTCKILIAEDEPFIVESLKFLFKREGFHVDAVSDGGDVMSALSSHQPDLLVLDVMLPTMNGFEILRRMRGEVALGNVAVLALTAKGQDEDRKRLLDNGADDFLTKPFSNGELIERVKTLLNGTH